MFDKVCEHRESVDGCALCWAHRRAETRRPVTPIPAPAIIPLPIRPRCAHEGPVLEWCHTCAGELRHVRECDLHERCTRGLVGGPVRCCIDCSDYRPEGAESSSGFPVRHLLYHVYPVKLTGVWQRNVDELLARLPLFTGIKVIAIVEGPECDPAEAVIDRLPGCEFVRQRNDPERREVPTWAPMWERLLAVRGAAPMHGEAVFLAHAKGVTHGPEHTCHDWTRLMYHVCLDHWPRAEALLQTRPLAGPFKKTGAGFAGSRSSWHFSGTFFWARLQDCLDRWWLIERNNPFGTEAWPGVAFTPEQAGALFHEGTVATMNLYDRSYWDRVVWPEFERWKSQNSTRRSGTG